MKQKEISHFTYDQHELLDNIYSYSNQELKQAISELNPPQNVLSMALCTTLSDLNIDKSLTLLKAGADPNYQNGSPLIILAGNIECNENITLLDLLVEHGCKIDGTNGQNQGFTQAVAEENTSMVKRCLEYGGLDISFRNSEALTTATRTGNIEIIKMLGEYDSKQDFAECVCLAAEEQNIPAIDYLMTKVNSDELKHNPIERAAFFDSYSAVYHLVENHNIPINHYDNTFVATAISSPNKEFVQYAISKMEQPLAVVQDTNLMTYIANNKPELISDITQRMQESMKSAHNLDQQRTTYNQSNNLNL